MPQQNTINSAGDGPDRWTKVLERLHEFVDAAPEVIARGVNRVLKFFMGGTHVERVRRDLQPFVSKVNALEPEILRLDDIQLRAKTEEFRLRLAIGKAPDELRVDEVTDWPALCYLLVTAEHTSAPSVGKRIWELLTAPTRRAVEQAGELSALEHERQQDEAERRRLERAGEADAQGDDPPPATATEQASGTQNAAETAASPAATERAFERLAQRERARRERSAKLAPLSAENRASLVAELNALIQREDLFREEDVQGLHGPLAVRNSLELLRKGMPEPKTPIRPSGGDVAALRAALLPEQHTYLLNRMILQSAFPEAIEALDDGEELEDMLPEVFAVAREAADRKIGMCKVFYRPFGFKPDRLADPRLRAAFEEAQAQVDAVAEAAGLWGRGRTGGSDTLIEAARRLKELEDEADRMTRLAEEAERARRREAADELTRLEARPEEERSRADLARAQLYPESVQLLRLIEAAERARLAVADHEKRKQETEAGLEVKRQRMHEGDELMKRFRADLAGVTDAARRIDAEERLGGAQEEVDRRRHEVEQDEEFLKGARARSEVLKVEAEAAQARLDPKAGELVRLLVAADEARAALGSAQARLEKTEALVAELEELAKITIGHGGDPKAVGERAEEARQRAAELGTLIGRLTEEAERAGQSATEATERLEGGTPKPAEPAARAALGSAQAQLEETEALVAELAELAKLTIGQGGDPKAIGERAEEARRRAAELQTRIGRLAEEAERAGQSATEATARLDAEIPKPAESAAGADDEVTDAEIIIEAAKAAALNAAADRALKEVEEARGRLEAERAPEVAEAERKRREAIEFREAFRQAAAQRAMTRTSEEQKRLLTEAGEELTRLEEIARKKVEEAAKAHKREDADAALLERLDAEGIRARNDADRAFREFQAIRSRIETAAVQWGEVDATAEECRVLDDRAADAQKALDAARSRPSTPPAELERLEDDVKQAQLNAANARERASAVKRPLLDKILGPVIAKLDLPAPFYEEIRRLYPLYRPPFRMRPFDVQLIGGMVLNQGKIAEMITGEGKTLVATLPAYVNALAGRHIHVVTVNDYLADRDRWWMGPMLEGLGLSVGLIQSEMHPIQRKPEYTADVTYGTNNEFGFDYLRDNMKDRVEEQVQGPLQFAIIDEVDNILIDEARTPLIISGPAEGSVERYVTSHDLVKRLIGVNHQRVPREPAEREEFLRNYDYTYNLKDHSVALTERGIRNAQKYLRVDSLYTGRNMDWPPYIEAALKAKELYKRDVEYVVQRNEETKQEEVIIVDEFTGRLMPGRRWSDGLHQAVEAKEKARGARIEIREENQTLGTITLQNYFRLYAKKAGMTGTALSEAGEFLKVYKLEVVPIPPNRKLNRTQCLDRIYGTEKEKWDAIIGEIDAVHKTGRPILVGTLSVEKSEKLSTLLKNHGLKHVVLNAKEHEKEAGIIALAGWFGAVTVSTNMAGRGTDIVLGGCTWQEALAYWQENGLAPRNLSAGMAPEDIQTRLEAFWFDSFGLRKEKEADVSPEEMRRRLETFWRLEGMAPLRLVKTVAKEGKPVLVPIDGIADLGGLHIIGTERHEARRIDNQLRGRSGRQGDPGSSRFFVSLDDELMRLFMAPWVRRFMVRAGLKDGQPIESGMVSRSIERAQRKVEEQNFEARKHVLEYDEVMDIQRKDIYRMRQDVLEGGARREAGDVVDRALARFLARDLLPPSTELPDRALGLLQAHLRAFGAEISPEEWGKVKPDDLVNLASEKLAEARPQGITPEDLEAWVRVVLSDCRADGGAYPEQWQLDRIVRWADGLGAECTRDELAAVIREQLAGFVGQEAGKQTAAGSLDEFLAGWFTLATEQDPALLGGEPRWTIKGFQDWLQLMGVWEAARHSRPGEMTYKALFPIWQDAARPTLAGRPLADVAADLSRRAAGLYLASSIFGGRPEAARITHWADRRLGLRLPPKRVEEAYRDLVTPALAAAIVRALADRLKTLPPAEARGRCARSIADWHLTVHLRFKAHNTIALAAVLGGRLRLKLDRLDLARRPAGDIADFVLDKLDRRPAAEGGIENLEGLEDIVFDMIENSIARLVDRALAGERGSAPSDRCFVAIGEFAHELGLAVSESQWRAFDFHELRLHLLREAAKAYPAQEGGEGRGARGEGKTEEEEPSGLDPLASSFVPRFVRKTVGMFLSSEAFRERPGYDSLAAWARQHFTSLPPDAQLEAKLKSFSEAKLADVRQRLVEAKLADYKQAGTQLEDAIAELVPATLETYRAFGQGDEMDFAGLATAAREYFDVSVSVDKLEEECEGDERRGVRVITGLAKARYARRGLDAIVNDAVEAAFRLCLPEDHFPSQWHCDNMLIWLRGAGLATVASADDIRNEALADIESYLLERAVAECEKQSPEAIRTRFLTTALNVFLETDLADEGRNFVSIKNTCKNKYDIDLEPYELSKVPADDLETLIRQRAYEAYQLRKQKIHSERMLWTIRQLLLQSVDVKWKDHLLSMDHLRGVIGFRGYGQQDPKVEYKREGYAMFDAMTKSIEDTVTDYLLKVEFRRDEEEARSRWQADSYVHAVTDAFRQQQQQQAARSAQGSHQGPPAPRPIVTRKEPGRNNPCPCGKKQKDGKPMKYKNCCGRR